MLMNIRKSIKSQKGFTLVELLVVVVIIGVLAAIAIPKFTGSTETANYSKAVADMRTIESACAMAVAKGATLAAGDLPATVTAHLARVPVPPTGKLAGPNKTTTISTTVDKYQITADGRATIDGKTIDDLNAK